MWRASMFSYIKLYLLDTPSLIGYCCQDEHVTLQLSAGYCRSGWVNNAVVWEDIMDLTLVVLLIIQINMEANRYHIFSQFYCS